MGGSSSTCNTAEEHLDERPLHVTNLGDTASLKRCVDEATALVVLSQGYEEDVFFSNVRIVLGVLACACALTAQFWPSPFPNNWTLTAACVAGYCLFSVALNWHVNANEGDAILFTHCKDGSPANGPGLRVSTEMLRYSDEITIVIGPKDASSAKPIVRETFSVCRWFDVNGLMEKDVIHKDVMAILKRYESGDKEPKKSK
mmetsp:Transcript_28880/g.81337  ORF Transcript_28880/g.81337 Transcript_28880/m.81337 type:complete len:201 (-) Transcript_28880:238-840(-)